MFKNRKTKDPKGRPKEKVNRMKTIVQQVREKAINKNKTKARKTKAKELPCLLCHEEGHNVETCKYMGNGKANPKRHIVTSIDLFCCNKNKCIYEAH